MPNLFSITDDILIAGFDVLCREHNMTIDNRICRQANMKLNNDKHVFDAPAFLYSLK